MAKGRDGTYFSSPEQDGLLLESQNPCHPIHYLICFCQTCMAAVMLRVQKVSQSGDRDYDPLENKCQSWTSIRVSPRSFQGIHLPGTEKTEAEGLQVMMALLVLCIAVLLSYRYERGGEVGQRGSL